MNNRQIEQAYLREGRVVASSPGIDDIVVEELMAKFGSLEAGRVATFAKFGSHAFVATVNGPIARVLVIQFGLYAALTDPFQIARRFPPDWSGCGPLSELIWTDDLLPPRTVAQVRELLKTGDGPTLLGAAQALVDGGRVALTEPAMIEQVWMLLPDAVRAELSVASFAPTNALGFHLLATPIAPDGFLTSEQAGDYPEGKYELALQIAAETEDERELQQLFARRSSRQAIKLLLTILGLALAVGLAAKVLTTILR